jgi:hypothetical protein
MARLMTDKAEGPPDRGSLLLIRIIVFLSLRIGRPLGRALLYPISLYFLVFAPSARRASSQYLTIVLQRRPGLLDLFRHLHVHASVLLDRAVLACAPRFRSGTGLNIEDQSTGSGLHSARRPFGSLTCWRLAAEHKVAVKAMMDVDVSRKFNRILGSVDPTFSDSVIALGTPTSLIAASRSCRGACRAARRPGHPRRQAGGGPFRPAGAAARGPDAGDDAEGAGHLHGLRQRDRGYSTIERPETQAPLRARRSGMRLAASLHTVSNILPPLAYNRFNFTCNRVSRLHCNILPWGEGAGEVSSM